MVMKTILYLIIYYDSIGKTICHLFLTVLKSLVFFGLNFLVKKLNFNKLLLKIYETCLKKQNKTYKMGCRFFVSASQSRVGWVKSLNLTKMVWICNFCSFSADIQLEEGVFKIYLKLIKKSSVK